MRASLRVNAVEFGGFDQRVGNGSGFATGLGSHEQVVFAPDSNGAHATFGCLQSGSCGNRSLKRSYRGHGAIGQCPLLALSGHLSGPAECPLSGGKRTCVTHRNLAGAGDGTAK